MGNQATKVSDSASATASSIKKRLTIRRRRPETVDDFTAEDIQKKIDGIPVLTNQEISVLKSSWELIAKKIEIVSYGKNWLDGAYDVFPILGWSTYIFAHI